MLKREASHNAPKDVGSFVNVPLCVSKIEEGHHFCQGGDLSNCHGVKL